MQAPGQLTSNPAKCAELFVTSRKQTEQICSLLETEDHVVQPAPFVSPPKWHLAHTTWFFDNFVLDSKASSSSPGSAHIHLLFNSYYKSQGEHWLQQHRGHLSRPTVREIQRYRDAVTNEIMAKLENDEFDQRELSLLELGIHHEQQHQELLLMDIKYILGVHPQAPAYDAVSVAGADTGIKPCAWLEFESGIREQGAAPAGGFAFDNEYPGHRIWLEAFKLSNRLVRNGEFLQFVIDGGYERPEFWLSDGWDWVNEQKIRAPLYWRQVKDSSGYARWYEYHLGGEAELVPELPVSHVSYYEASAYAAWAGARLPAEAELEVAAAAAQVERAGDGTDRPAFWAPGSAIVPDASLACDNIENGLLWQWTRSAYGPYSGYKAESGPLGEYNGKFMSNQYVLRGGCVATPKGHWRTTYRNFYRPADRWCFSGIRLAKDC